jgi:hypothetical protein
MPYFDPSKPLVNSWFSATKRSLVDCARPSVLDRLKQENGLTILYQYLHRYADPETYSLDANFTKAIKWIAGESEILVDTVNSLMERLRKVQHIFLVEGSNFLWIINTNKEEVSNFQFKTDTDALSVVEYDGSCYRDGELIVFPSLSPETMYYIEFSKPIMSDGVRKKRYNRREKYIIDADTAYIYVNTSREDWLIDDRVIPSGAFDIRYKEGKFDERPIPLSQLDSKEELNLVFAQASIILRELLYKGRSLDDNKFLSKDNIKLEDHSNW